MWILTCFPTGWCPHPTCSKTKLLGAPCFVTIKPSFDTTDAAAARKAVGRSACSNTPRTQLSKQSRPILFIRGAHTQRTRPSAGPGWDKAISQAGRHVTKSDTAGRTAPGVMTQGDGAVPPGRREWLTREGGTSPGEEGVAHGGGRRQVAGDGAVPPGESGGSSRGRGDLVRTGESLRGHCRSAGTRGNQQGTDHCVNVAV